MSDSDTTTPANAPNSSGLCQCGCGMLTPISRVNNTRLGYVKGEHIRFVHTHCGTRLPPNDPPINPSGTCMCGCGQPTPLVTRGSRRSGYRSGDHLRYAHGHHLRGVPKTDEFKAKISAANTGRPKKRKPAVCPNCGQDFRAAPGQVYCSKRCGRAQWHGLVHSKLYAHFEKHCAICGRTDDLVGDHNHGTGKPRGILCRNCNLAIGNMKDRPDLLRKAAEYLEDR